MERTKRIAIKFFQSLGYSAEEIPESDGKRADVRACDGDLEYITEVKERMDDPETIANQLTTFTVDDEQLSMRISPIGRSNRLDGIFKTGGKQLLETPCAESAYRLIWLHCDGVDDELQEIRARNTFLRYRPCDSKG